MLASLPQDVLITLTSLLEAPEINVLAATCKSLRAIALEFGYAALYRRMRLCPVTVQVRWPIEKRATFAWQIERARRTTDCIVSTLASWPSKCLPIVALDADRLVVAHGTALQTIAFQPLPVRFPALSKRGKRGVEDISAVALWHDKIVFGRVSGAIEAVSSGGMEFARYGQTKASIQALACRGDVMASACAVGHGGTISLHQLRAPWTEPTSTTIPSKPWSLHTRDPWLAVGSTGFDPLMVYPITETGFATPRTLGRSVKGRSAVYALTTAVPGSLLSPRCLVTGWYDSTVRIYDLREASKLPRLSLSTRWSEDAIYSLASAGFQVVAGMARHSALRIADLRKNDGGLTLYVAKEASPVYSLAMEGSRIFGATSSQAFMLEYGPDVVARAFGADGRGAPWTKLRPRYHFDDAQLRTSSTQR